MNGPEKIVHHDPRYIADIDTAKQVLSPIVLRLKGLIQAWGIFHSADELTTAYEASFEKLSWQTKMAFSKAIVAEYIKPWQTYNGKALKSLQLGNKIDFLESAIKSSSTHSALNELRQQSVAHTNESFEAIHVNILGAEVRNELPTGGRQPNTLEKVFLPMAPELSVKRGIWWINNRETIERVKELARSCKKATKNQITTEVANLRDTCLEHMHVLHELHELFSLDQIPPTGNDENGNPLIEFAFAETPSGHLHLAEPKQSKIGDANIQSSIVLYQPDPTLQSETDVKGNGYHLQMKLDKESGKMVFNVSFPEYPFPGQSA